MQNVSAVGVGPYDRITHAGKIRIKIRPRDDRFVCRAVEEEALLADIEVERAAYDPATVDAEVGAPSPYPAPASGSVSVVNFVPSYKKP